MDDGKWMIPFGEPPLRFALENGLKTIFHYLSSIFQLLTLFEGNSH
jgi:hypothetical protein